jgi:hypothetical protein
VKLYWSRWLKRLKNICPRATRFLEPLSALHWQTPANDSLNNSMVKWVIYGWSSPALSIFCVPRYTWRMTSTYATQRRGNSKLSTKQKWITTYKQFLLLNTVIHQSVARRRHVLSSPVYSPYFHGHKTCALCNNMKIDWLWRHVASGAMRFFDCIAHAYTSPTLVPLPPNASLTLRRSAVESA